MSQIHDELYSFLIERVTRWWFYILVSDHNATDPIMQNIYFVSKFNMAVGCQQIQNKRVYWSVDKTIYIYLIKISLNLGHKDIKFA
jgi:hypothetical protein